MDIDIIRKVHSVRVCNGSGIIVRPLDKSSLYILTNYHVVVDKDDKERTLGFEFEDGSPLNADNILVVDKILCKDKDIAIIKINAKGLDLVRFLRLGTSRTKAVVHMGFPIERTEGAAGKTTVLHICHNDGNINEHLVEYEYNQQVRKDEIVGMSGGGVFDGNYYLVGVHKQLSNEDEKECLGKAAYIPISCYKDFLKQAGWSPIQEFDLSSFAEFTSIAFDFDDDSYITQAAEELLYCLDEYKKRLESLSPEKIIETLKARGRLGDEVVVDELNRELWIDFTEFVIGTMLVLNIDEKQDDFIISVYDRFHFVFSQEDFDFFEAREKLDPNILVGMQKKSQLFIGGLKEPRTFKGCVLDVKTVPNIAEAGLYNMADIARSKKKLLKCMTIINAKIFKRGVPHCVDNSDEVNIEIYKQLLKQHIKYNEA